MKILFPLLGVDETLPPEEQRTGTTRSMQNMVAQNPRNRVIQGAQRAGTERFVTAQVDANKIQELGCITTRNKLIDYSAAALSENVTTLWEGFPSRLDTGLSTLQEVRRLAIDDEGNIFSVWGSNAITISSSDGEEIQTVFVDGLESDTGLVPIALDEFGNFYVGTGSNVRTGTTANEKLETVWKYEKVSKPDGTSWEYRLAWTTNLQIPSIDDDLSPPHHQDRCQALAYVRETQELYVVAHNGSPAATPALGDITLYVLADLDFSNPTIKRRVILQDNAGNQLAGNGGGTGYAQFATDIAIRTDGLFYVSVSGDGANGRPPGVYLYQSELPPVSGAGGTGKAPTINAYQEITFQAPTDFGGGYGLVLSPDEKRCYTAGTRLDAGGTVLETYGAVSLREAASGTALLAANIDSINDGPPVKATAPTSVGPIFVQLAVDSFGALYIPFYTEGLGATTDAYTLIVYRPQSTFTLFTFLMEYITGGALSVANRNASQPCHAVAVSSKQPKYLGDLSSDIDTCVASGATACERAEEVILGLGSNTFTSSAGTANTLRKIRLVDSARNTNTPRTAHFVAVANSDLFKMDPVGNTVSNTFTTDEDPFTAGSSPPARFVQGVNLLAKRYYTDGRTYAVFDPFDDGWLKLEAIRGELPKRCQIITAWLGRLFLARAADDPHFWKASRTGNPLDWDEAPAREDVGQSISGTNPGGPGLCPDAITALIPDFDDLLVFGCDHSLQRLTGDPLDGGTRFDLMTDEIGMAFGEPWAKDRNGSVYFVDSEGGLNRLLSSPPWYERLSRDRIENRLRSVNFSTNYVRLRWDNRYEGLWILLFPFAATGLAATEHYFYDPRLGAFYPIKFSTPPTAVATFDSDDPDDRAVTLGFEDGYVRNFGDSSNIDDNTTGTGDNIDSFVDIGPMRSEEWEQWRVSGYSFTLARDLGPVSYELFVQDTADAPLDRVAATGQLGPGRTRIRKKVKAAYITIRLRSSGPLSWAYERGEMEGIVRAGRTKSVLR